MPVSNLKPQNLFSSGQKNTSSPTNNDNSNDVSNKNGDEKSTHIEVCARVRPLQISMLSSSSYFGGNEDHITTATKGIQSPARKPPLPRKPGIPTPKKMTTTTAQKNQGDSDAPTPSSPPHDDVFYAWDVIGNDTASQSPKTDIVPGRTHQYTLDRVYGPSCTTKDLYNQSVRPLVSSAMEGYHTAVLAYGQTSTGKTYTMTGTPSSPGIIPLAIHQCFQCLETNREYLVRVSYLEVYKEQIRDLLAEGASQIRLFDHREQGLIIKGLREEVVTSPKQVFEILAQGEKRRKIGATNMNQHSSRSHVMVRLWIESRAVSTSTSVANSSGSGGKRSSTTLVAANGGSKGGTAVRVSSLSLVDLAGSESVKLHGSDEARRQEGHYINKSLMALGKVVYALSEQGLQKDNKINNAPQHIPYRDSKLTRLLQPSLSGNAQMVLICCISPLVTHLEESHNTFKFAARAKAVPQRATIQESMDEKTLLQTYREEIEALKQQLRDAKKQQEALLAKQQEKQQQPQRPVAEEPVEEDMDDEVKELQLAIRNMEHLILKSKAANPLPSSVSRSFSEDELMDSSDEDNNNDDDDETALLALMTETQKSSGATRLPGQVAHSSPVRTPDRSVEDTSSDMYAELHRIQGLLGSVLKKRSKGQKSPTKSNGIVQPNPTNFAEVNKLRAQLEEQEVASSLRKADAAFLTKQLEEKDSLLAEVAKILDQVEQRQIELEAENADLKRQILALKQGAPYSPINMLRNGMIEM